MTEGVRATIALTRKLYCRATCSRIVSCTYMGRELLLKVYTAQ